MKKTKMIDGLIEGKRYAVKIQSQIVKGIFLRKVKKFFIFNRYEFIVRVEKVEDIRGVYEINKSFLIKHFDILYKI